MKTPLQHNFFWLLCVAWTVLIVWAAGFPVFWDMYGTVKTAHYYINTGFTNLFPNGDGFSDNGHFPLYNLYLAMLFKIFGPKLWVAHFSVLPFLWGVMWQLRKYCLRYINEAQTNAALFLTLALPAFLNLNIHFSAEVSFVFAALWLINALHDASRATTIIASVFLCLLNLRGVPFVLLLWLYVVLLRKDKSGHVLLVAPVLMAAWMLLHYKISGWFLTNPANTEHRTLVSAPAVFRNLLYCFFRAADQGSVLLWLGIAYAVLIKKMRSQVFVLPLLAGAAVVLFSLPISNPVSNRYFLLTNLLLLPAFVQSVSAFKKALALAMTGFAAIVLFSFNWVLYPERYSNAWDCSLQGLSYFEVRRQLDQYVTQNAISTVDVEAGFQVYFNDRFYLLNGADREYRLLSDTLMPTAPWVAMSDICNNYHARRNEFLNNNYTPEKVFTNGPVYIKLYHKKGLF